MTDIIVLLIWSMRVLAAAAGVLVGLDSYRILTGERERPPHNARRNAWAWAWIGGGCFIGAGSFLWFGMTYYTAGTGKIAQDAAVLAIWTGLAAGLIQRAASRAEQPRLIYAAATMFLVMALVLAGFDRAAL